MVSLLERRGEWMRVVGNAEYKSYLSMPWSDMRASIRSFTFYGDKLLVGENGTACSGSNTGADYAVI